MSERLVLELHNKLAMVQDPEGKSHLVRLQQRKAGLRGVVQNFAAGVAPQHIPVEPDDILSIFWHEMPRFGKVYNTYVEPHVKSEKLSRWGRITYYRDLSDAELENFHAGLQLTYRRFIRRYGLRFLLPIDLEVRNPKGKMVGMYHPHKGEREHYIELAPQSFIQGENKKNAMRYIMRIAAHELGHPLWQLYLPDAIKARWVRLYHSFAQVQELKTNDLDAIRQDVVGSKISLREYQRQAPDETKLFLAAILLWIKRVHHLDSKYINLLLGENDSLVDYWPHSRLHLSQIKVPITEYAGKNPEETFCEALSVTALREELPRPITKLVARSIKAVQPK